MAGISWRNVHHSRKGHFVLLFWVSRQVGVNVQRDHLSKGSYYQEFAAVFCGLPSRKVARSDHIHTLLTPFISRTAIIS